MPSHTFGDYMTDMIGIVLVVASVTLLFLCPDLPGLAASTANLALTGVLLLSGASVRDRNALAWERIALAAWLAVSPWMIGVSVVGGVAWFSIVCASLVFFPAASLVSQPLAFGKANALDAFPTYGPGKKRRM
ncbi:SPW repeat protein [Rhizobium sp. CNPSo 3968]|uniref:SPW repeat domain-containing protein n=1 Tax=Rhizobium sp. CNPSo 3968 TaxID=3021408 RepID=UPI002550B989|nr:SPW repeat protein [Rhizobium sp. CNPSo 3968]MDK4718836.1 SPW repeat protein [Rhizobium sp. CNPSo 3968]